MVSYTLLQKYRNSHWYSVNDSLEKVTKYHGITMNILVEELDWSNARDRIQASEPKFAEIIDELSPSGKKFPLFAATYRYGDIIYHKGITYLPTKTKELIPLSSPHVPEKIKSLLGYSPLPLATLTGSGVEVFHELEDRVFSLAYFTNGLQLGIWEMFAPAAPFIVSAGARSLHILPKICEANSHKRLRRFGVQAPIPKTPFEQWHVFKQAAAHPDFYMRWGCKIIFFSRPWIEKIQEKDGAWLKLHNFLLERAWKHSIYGRNKVMLDTAWEYFSRLLTNKHIKPNSHIVDTLKHLIFVATGALPAFKPATDNKAGPIDGFLKMYLEDYNLKNYAPSMMQPWHFNNLEQPTSNVYYSLQLPTYLDSIPKYRMSFSTRIDLAELSLLMNEFTSEMIKNDNLISCGNQDIQKLFSDIQFNYFHTDADPSNNIRPSLKLAEEDYNLLYLPQELKNRKVKFCDRSAFARGCVRLSKNHRD